METRANYALIGLFTLAAIIGAFGFVYWFKTFGQQTERTHYVLHFSGSVSGLLTGANVLFNGIKVGEVSALNYNNENPDQVFAVISVNASAPIKTDTAASLEFGGLTGVASVALLGGGKESPRLPPNGVLEAQPSQLQGLMHQAQRLSVKADAVLGDVDKLLHNVNGVVSDTAPDLKATIANLSQITGALTDKKDGFVAALNAVEPGKVRSIVKNADEAMAKVNNLLGDGAGKNMITDISDAAKSIKKLADSLNRFAASGLRQYEGLAVDGRKTLQDVDSTVKQLKRDPQSIIFGPKPALPDYQGR